MFLWRAAACWAMCAGWPILAVGQAAPDSGQKAPGTGTAATQAAPAPAAAASSGPTDAKAKQTYSEALVLMKQHKYIFALDGFRKADKQDGGHCVSCEIQAYKAAREINDFKAAREQAALLEEHVTATADKVQALYMAGEVCLMEGMNQKHDKAFEEADSDFQSALKIQPGNANCLYGDGMALAHLKQDGAAKERFEEFLKRAPASDTDYPRAERFAEHPELARGRVAPNFQLTTLDGQKLTLESLTGKVVLVDFWATWCGPCKEALPHVRDIAKRFAGPQFQVISISMDRDDAKWRDFIGKNEMTWMQYRDGYFDGPLATMFGVRAIPATFTIDADGILQDQHVGDADMVGKLKKLIAQAQEAASKKTVAQIP